MRIVWNLVWRDKVKSCGGRGWTALLPKHAAELYRVVTFTFFHRVTSDERPHRNACFSMSFSAYEPGRVRCPIEAAAYAGHGAAD
jgi:hypothetical protein